jgi:hydroxyacylglutathione hydrolase
VAHSHSHSDHVAGDGQLTDRPDTTVVGADLAAVTGFLGLPGWPRGTAQVDLGDRVVDVIPSPGHDEPAVTWYDRATMLLLTGDTLYPGRLYVFDWPAFTATVDRLLAFAEDHPVAHLLGAHIEMTRSPGVDYVIRTTYQPEEPPLELSLADCGRCAAPSRRSATPREYTRTRSSFSTMACPTGTSVDPARTLEPLPLLASIS